MPHFTRLNCGAEPAPRNHLLAALPSEDLARLWPRLEPVELPFRHVVQVPEEPITAVHFPEEGWISMMALLSDGGAAEVGLIGREGMLGLPVFFGAETTTLEGMVQGPGKALRLSAAAFREELEAIPSLRPLLLRYAFAHQQQVAQTAACNGRHVLEQRLARWLLMAHDRADGDDFPMTQEFLATMLCVHRPGVTVAARVLQQTGYIRYAPGNITVTDRAGLEEVACECYGAVRRQFRQLLGVPTG